MVTGYIEGRVIYFNVFNVEEKSGRWEVCGKRGF